MFAGVRSYRTRSTVLVSALVLGLLFAWWWPGIIGRGDSIDIAISSPPSHDSSREVIERRLREEGFATKWIPRASDSCVIPPIADRYDTTVVLLPDSNACTRDEFIEMWSAFRRATDSQRFVAVRSWRDAPDSSDPLTGLQGFADDVLDPLPLIGENGRSQLCLWWDDCLPSGLIDTQIDGSLTFAGQQRLARLIVAGVLD